MTLNLADFGYRYWDWIPHNKGANEFYQPKCFYYKSGVTEKKIVQRRKTVGKLSKHMVTLDKAVLLYQIFHKSDAHV